MNYLDEAFTKLDEKTKPSDRYGSAMQGAVKTVAQGGSFSDCLKHVSEGVKNNAISDKETAAKLRAALVSLADAIKRA